EAGQEKGETSSSRQNKRTCRAARVEHMSTLHILNNKILCSLSIVNLLLRLLYWQAGKLGEGLNRGYVATVGEGQWGQDYSTIKSLVTCAEGALWPFFVCSEFL